VRVAHVIPLLAEGGAARTVVALARSLPEIEHRAIALREARPEIARQARAAGAAVIESPAPEVLRAELEDADVLHVHFWNSPELIEMLQGPLPPCRMVLWCHVGGATAPQVLSAELAALADLAVAVTPLTTRLEHLGESAPSTVIPSALDPSRLGRTGPPRPEGFNVGYVGNVSPSKMHPDFVSLSSAVSVPGVRFVVCGLGDGFHALARQAESLGTRERFDLRGFVEDVGSVLAELDVFGYPLCEDNYSGADVALAEAMYAGVPPVVLPHGGTALSVVDGESGIVARDEREYVRAIERLGDDRDLRARLSAGARARARATFSPTATAASWRSVYGHLMDGPKRERSWPGEPPATGALRFLTGLGGLLQAEEDLDRAILNAPVSVIESDGGVLDYRRRYPEDPDLRLWSGLGMLARGRHVLAAGELTAAVRLGCDADRAAPYLNEAARRLGQPIEVA